ncbi:uncharacterized protein LOC130858399 [Hippopotamus amphibius kiboko]|uniref:uncharacterized protein LOC130858399 n=1 Tax=Hippopotamus amphibius kiboko TaxID=575201 RepID=UPI002591FEDD|nr:uncharacterized protein LOC130858399 [Hippopotamus amphibius kiboko]
MVAAGGTCARAGRRRAEAEAGLRGAPAAPAPAATPSPPAGPAPRDPRRRPLPTSPPPAGALSTSPVPAHTAPPCPDRGSDSPALVGAQPRPDLWPSLGWPPGKPAPGVSRLVPPPAPPACPAHRGQWMTVLTSSGWMLEALALGFLLLAVAGKTPRRTCYHPEKGCPGHCEGEQGLHHLQIWEAEDSPARVSPVFCHCHAPRCAPRRHVWSFQTGGCGFSP